MGHLDIYRGIRPPPASLGRDYCRLSLPLLRVVHIAVNFMALIKGTNPYRSRSQHMYADSYVYSCFKFYFGF